MLPKLLLSVINSPFVYCSMFCLISILVLLENQIEIFVLTLILENEYILSFQSDLSLETVYPTFEERMV